MSIKKKTSKSRTVVSADENELVEKPVKKAKKSATKRAGRPKKATAEPFTFEIEPRASRLSAKERTQRWNRFKSLLRNKDVSELVDIIGVLCRISDDAAEYVRSIFSKDGSDGESLLEEYRKKIVTPFGLGKKVFGKIPLIGGLKKMIRDYLKGTGDVRGAVDLSLTLQETALAFTQEWGEINDQFYDPLILATRDLTKLVTESRECATLFKEFKERLLKVGEQGDWLGWGYGDAIHEMVEDIFYANGIGLEREYDAADRKSRWVYFELDEDDFEEIERR